MKKASIITVLFLSSIQTFANPAVNYYYGSKIWDAVKSIWTITTSIHLM